MAAWSEVNTVWIGFMDIVPVIGTVKETVELVLALYEGNKAVVKEKEKAIENFVKLSLKKLTQPDKPAAAAAAAASEFSGLKNVTGVIQEKIIEHVNKGSKKGQKQTADAQAQRNNRVEAIKEDMLKKIRVINPQFHQDLKEELTRSNRGEHVFNNDILKFHSKVLTEFITMHHISNLRGYNQGVMDDLGRHTLPQNTENEIQDNMVVHFLDDEFYVNANAVMYGEYSRALRGAMLDVLNHINPGDVTQEEERRVNFVIDHMNNFQIYVDTLAKVKWIDNRQDRQTRFNGVRGKVANMYSTDRGLNWCTGILRNVETLFNPRQ